MLSHLLQDPLAAKVPHGLLGVPGEKRLHDLAEVPRQGGVEAGLLQEGEEFGHEVVVLQDLVVDRPALAEHLAGQEGVALSALLVCVLTRENCDELQQL